MTYALYAMHISYIYIILYSYSYICMCIYIYILLYVENIFESMRIITLAHDIFLNQNFLIIAPIHLDQNNVLDLT